MDDVSQRAGYGDLTERERFAKTENPKLKNIPTDPLKEYVAQGIPVIVHQYWSEVGSKGHYRLMTGYDKKEKSVYLNDSSYGSEVTQSYDRFLEPWNVNEPWLRYNTIVFNGGIKNLLISILHQPLL